MQHTFYTYQYIELHVQCNLLTHDELDLVLMGFLSSAILDSDDVKDGYMHHGVDVGLLCVEILFIGYTC